MHSPNADIRTDNDTFEVRGDVSVEDACHTSLRLVRMAVAQFEVLSADADLDALHRDAIEGCLPDPPGLRIHRPALCDN